MFDHTKKLGCFCVSFTVLRYLLLLKCPMDINALGSDDMKAVLLSVTIVVMLILPTDE